MHGKKHSNFGTYICFDWIFFVDSIQSISRGCADRQWNDSTTAINNRYWQSRPTSVGNCNFIIDISVVATSQGFGAGLQERAGSDTGHKDTVQGVAGLSDTHRKLPLHEPRQQDRGTGQFQVHEPAVRTLQRADMVRDTQERCIGIRPESRCRASAATTQDPCHSQDEGRTKKRR